MRGSHKTSILLFIAVAILTLWTSLSSAGRTVLWYVEGDVKDKSVEELLSRIKSESTRIIVTNTSSNTYSDFNVLVTLPPYVLGMTFRIVDENQNEVPYAFKVDNVESCHPFEGTSNQIWLMVGSLGPGESKTFHIKTSSPTLSPYLAYFAYYSSGCCSDEVKYYFSIQNSIPDNCYNYGTLFNSDPNFGVYLDRYMFPTYTYHVYSSTAPYEPYDNNADTDIDIVLHHRTSTYYVKHDWNSLPGIPHGHFNLLSGTIEMTRYDSYTKAECTFSYGIASVSETFYFYDNEGTTFRIGDTDYDSTGPIIRWIYVVKLPPEGITVEVE